MQLRSPSLVRRNVLRNGSSEHPRRRGLLARQGVIDPAQRCLPDSRLVALLGLSAGAVALISAAAGVLGGVLGALAGGWATYQIERERQAFEHRRDLRSERRTRAQEHAVALGVARVWRTRFDDFRHLVTSYSEGDQYWPDAYDGEFSWNLEDMKRLAAIASADEWHHIDVGMSAVRAICSARALDPKEDYAFDDDDRRVVVDDGLPAVDEAIDALDELAKRFDQTRPRSEAP